jgi:hypothetical protein
LNPIQIGQNLKAMSHFKPTISLSGGIGNQLFQWAAAHYLFKGRVFSLELGHYQFNLERQFQLEPILKSCPHFAGYASKLADTHLPKYFQWATAKGVPTNLLESLGFFQEEFLKSDSLLRIQKRTERGLPVIVEGLFQDIDIVDDAWPLIRNELTEALREPFDSAKTRLGLPDRYAAIHVRRGDYPISPEPSHAIGQLDDSYFVQIAAKFDLPIVILTENTNEVSNLSKTLNAKLVVSNEEANPLETLSILKNSEQLVGSNSSLSWWGAYLASKLNRQSNLPEKWSQWGNYENKKLKNESMRFSPSIWKLS